MFEFKFKFKFKRTKNHFIEDLFYKDKEIGN
jgi:hypothetical protein